MALAHRPRLRLTLRLLAVSLLLLLVVPGLWVELRPERPSLASDAKLSAAPDGRYRIYVADWGYHTSIILEQAPGWRLGPPGEEASPFVEFAWGDRRFYKDSDYRPHSLVITLLLPSEAVTYVDGWRAAPARGAGMRHLVVREVTAPELVRLANVLSAWRGMDAPYPTVGGFAGRFYPAPGRYLWWTDCNRWTVERLDEAGLARGGRGVIFSGQVFGRLREFRAAAVGAA